MKIKINDRGSLCIERAGKMKVQGCLRNDDLECGDWCPAWGEPGIGESVVELDLCKEAGTRICEVKNFRDERNMPDQWEVMAKHLKDRTGCQEIHGVLLEDRGDMMLVWTPDSREGAWYKRGNVRIVDDRAEGDERGHGE